MSEISVKETFRDIANTFDEVDRRVLLWTNSNVTAQFAAQSISLDLSNYDAVEIGYIDIIAANTDRNHEVTPLVVHVGEKGSMQAMFGGSSQTSGVFYMTVRQVVVSTTAVTFDSGYGGYPNTGWGVRNDMCLPHRIYGIQFGASAGGGSSGGTMNYPDLLHKPTINGVTLVEGLVTEDLDLGDTAHEEVTQAEFDALTPEQRDDGTVYFIRDGIVGNVFLDDNTPIGTIAPFGGTSDPSYWLICDGRAVSRTDYAALFGVIGTTYGAGDGSTTFNIPDLRGNVAMGASQDYDLGDTGGEAEHTLIISEMPSHRHPVSQSYDNSNYRAVSGGFIRFNTPAQTGGTGWADTNYATLMDPVGGSQPHNNMQPYVVTNYIIKYASTVSEHQANIDFYYPVGSYYETSNASFDPNITWGGTWVLENEGQVHVSAGSNYMIGDTGGEATHKLTVAEMPSHTHGHYYYGGSGATWGYNYSNGSSTKSAATEAASGIIPNGGGGAHNNMQPYIVVNRWHRTA